MSSSSSFFSFSYSSSSTPCLSNFRMTHYNLEAQIRIDHVVFVLYFVARSVLSVFAFDCLPVCFRRFSSLPCMNHAVSMCFVPTENREVWEALERKGKRLFWVETYVCGKNRQEEYDQWGGRSGNGRKRGTNKQNKKTKSWGWIWRMELWALQNLRSKWSEEIIEFIQIILDLWIAIYDKLRSKIIKIFPRHVLIVLVP